MYDLNELTNDTKENLTNDDKQELVTNIIESANGENGLTYCNMFGYNKDIEDLIISLNSADLCYRFSENIETENVNKHEKIVINSKNPELIYKFAENVYSANIKKLEHAIIDTKNCKFIKYFAENVEDSNKKKLLKTCKEIEEGTI